MRPAKMMCKLVGTSYVGGQFVTVAKKTLSTYPAIVSIVAHVKLATVVGKISQNDAEINEPCEHAGTQSTNRCRRLWVVRTSYITYAKSN